MIGFYSGDKPCESSIEGNNAKMGKLALKRRTRLSKKRAEENMTTCERRRCRYRFVDPNWRSICFGEKGLDVGVKYEWCWHTRSVFTGCGDI